MNSFEGKFTAWVDGKLSGQELEAFERTLEDRAAAEAEKNEALRLGQILRAHGQPALLQNADFFNAQLRQRIEAEAPTPISERPSPVFSPWRMLLAATGCLAAALVLFRVAVPHTPGPVPDTREFLARVLTAEPGDGISATAYQSQENRATVLWLDGLDYLPEPTPTPVSDVK